MATSRSNGRLPKFQRVMVVSAHPDDPDFGAGGSIARLADSGAEVTYVIVTDGRQGGEDPKQKDAELVAIREKEQRAAERSEERRVGKECRWGGWPEQERKKRERRGVGGR